MVCWTTERIASSRKIFQALRKLAPIRVSHTKEDYHVMCGSDEIDPDRSTRERRYSECSLPGVNGFVITRVGSGTNRADVLVTGMVRISTASLHGRGMASENTEIANK